MGMPLASPFVSALNAKNSNEQHSSPEITPAALVLLGVVGASLAIALGINQAYKAYKNYQIKKHLLKIKEANRIAEKHIGKITLSGCFETKSLPMPFKFDDPNDLKTVHSFHLEESQIENAGELPKQEGLVSLDDYLNEIQSALLLLKQYLQFRIKKSEKNESDDVTCGVLSHMMYLIKTYAMNFQGYKWDIAYLDAMCKYINEYASSSKHEDESQHFDYLSDVYTHLDNAKDLLIKHEENTSLAFAISEIKNTTLCASQLMLRTLSKLILPHQAHTAVDNAPIVNIANGLIRKKHIHTEISLPIIGIAKTYDAEILLPDSIFKEWIKVLSDYHLESIKEISPVGLDDISDSINRIEQEMIEILDKSKEKTKKEIQKIKEIFSKSHNFLTTKPDIKKPHETVAHYKPIENTDELLERILFYKKFALLTHQLISVTYLSKCILNGTKQLGEIYMKDPCHFHELFDKFYKIADQIKTKCQEIISSMEKMDQNLMISFQKQNLFETIKTNISALSSEIDIEKYNINTIRKTKSISSKKQKNTIIHQLSKVINKMSTIFELPTENLEPALALCPSSNNSHDTNSSSEKTSQSFTPEFNLETNKHEKLTTEELLDNIKTKITTIKSQENTHQPNELKAYQELYESLKEMHETTYKNKELKKTTEFICEKTLEFLNKSSKDRKEEAQTFYDSIQLEINKAKPLIEKEPPVWKKVLDAAWKIVLCLTIVGGVYLLWQNGAILPKTSKSKLEQVEKASLSMKKVLTPSP